MEFENDVASVKPKLPLAEALPIAQDVARQLNPFCNYLAIAGSIRRGKPMVGDGEIVADPMIVDGENLLLAELDRLVEGQIFRKAQIQQKNGKTTTRWGQKYRAIEYRGMKFDIFLTDADGWGSLYQIRTGPAEFNEAIMNRISPSEKFQKRGMKPAPFRLREGHVWYGEQKLKLETEDAWFDLLGIPYLPPHMRTPERALELFAKSKGWGDPKKYIDAPKQMTLMGFHNTYDEGAYIDAIGRHEKPAPSKAEEKPFIWRSPWLLTSGRVLVRCKGGFQLVEMSSPEAQRYATLLRNPMFTNAEKIAVEDWKDAHAGWQPIPDKVVDVADMPSAYMLREGAVVETVAMDNIAFTQDTYNLAIWRKYCRVPSLHDGDGQLPFGIKFSDSDRVYLLDGTHRTLAHRWRGMKSMQVQVVSYPETFAEACYPKNEPVIAFLDEVMAEVDEILKGEAVYA